MSIENAKAFLERVQSDDVLSARVEACSGRDALKQLQAIAAAADYVFTIEEYRRAVQESVDGELDNASLDGVLRDAGLEPPERYS